MSLKNTNHNDNYEWVGISRIAPFEATYMDINGVWYRTSFTDAPSWEHWDKLDIAMQNVIIKHIAH